MSFYFKSMVDFSGYFFVYVVIPAAQALCYLKTRENLLLSFFIVLFASMLYECYTRFNKDMEQVVKKCHFAISLITFILLAYSVFLAILVSQNVVVQSWMRWPYLLMIIPLIIVSWHGVNRAKADFDINGGK